jgi:hypothetical protein
MPEDFVARHVQTTCTGGCPAHTHLGAVTDPYSAYTSLAFDRPDPGVLRVTLDGPGLNSVSPEMHRHLADVWLTVDRDPDVRVAICLTR